MLQSGAIDVAGVSWRDNVLFKTTQKVCWVHRGVGG